MSARKDPFGWAGATIEGKYRVEEVVGEGGFGVVYRGHHLGFDETVAVKVLKLPAALAGAERERFHKTFLDEGKLLHRLSRGNAGIVQALDVGAATSPAGIWTPFLVLEWLDGRSLERDLADRRGRGEAGRSLADALALLEPAARALAAAHAQGIAHRDVKPANLFLARIADRTTLKVLDFGIAKVIGEMANITKAMAETGDSVKSFTPQYGAPEQFHRRYGATGPWTDVFALGLVLIEVVSGKIALDGDDATQLYILSTDPTQRPSLRAAGVTVSDEVEKALGKAFAVDPRERYLDAGAFWDALRAAAPAGAGSITATPVPRAVSVPDEAMGSMATGEYLEAVAGAGSSAQEGRTAPSGASAAKTELAPGSEAGGPATTSSPITSSKGGAAAARVEAPRPASSARLIVGLGLAAAGGAAIAAWVMVKKPAPPPPEVARVAPVVPTASAEAAPSAQVEETPGMVRVPAGAFAMGTDVGGKTERPIHQVTISHAFLVDRTEVTAGDYLACVKAGRCTPAVLHGPFVDSGIVSKFGALCTGTDPAKARFAVNCVDQAQAQAYCDFRGKRLPTEAEWEYAARGSDGRDFPWGNAPPACERGHFMRPGGDTCGGRPRGPIEAGSLPLGKSAFGALDMAGNVWEWVADGWDPTAYQKGARTDPESRFTSKNGVLRGGGWDYEPGDGRSTFRLAYDASTGHVSTGFRCVKTSS